jgi:hypothetical protein
MDCSYWPEEGEEAIRLRTVGLFGLLIAQLRIFVETYEIGGARF